MEIAPMAYFLIYTRDDAASPWAPQFGDSDQDAVMQERIDTYLRPRGQGFAGDCKHVASDIKIIRFSRTPTQMQVNAKTAEINA
jgi:hypothetical protein